jgi:hypothetical protein
MEQLGPSPLFGPPGPLNLYRLHLPLTSALPLDEYRKNTHRPVQILGPGRSGDRIRVGARFSAPVQTGHENHSASYTMGTGSYPRVERPGRGVNSPPLSSAEVKERVELYVYSLTGP